MKREEILAMEHGEQLDALVAEFVMGLPEVHVMDGSVWFQDNEGAYREVINYSADISAAWEVVEKVKSMLFSKRNRFLKELQTLTKKDSEYYIAWPDVFWTINPERICKAALLTALEEEQA